MANLLTVDWYYFFLIFGIRFNDIAGRCRYIPFICMYTDRIKIANSFVI